MTTINYFSNYRKNPIIFMVDSDKMLLTVKYEGASRIFKIDVKHRCGFTYAFLEYKIITSSLEGFINHLKDSSDKRSPFFYSMYALGVESLKLYATN